MNFYFVATENLKDERWDTNYWRPDLLVIIDQISRFKLDIIKLGTLGDISNGKSGSRIFTDNKEVQYLVITNLLKTGLNLRKKPRFVEEGGSNDPIRSRVRTGDILIPISGTGSIEKSTLVQDLDRKANISQDIARLRVDSDKVYSTALFLQSKWGVAQILRSEAGTGVTHLSLEDIRDFDIPLFPQDVEDWSREAMEALHLLHMDYVNQPNAEKKKRLEIERLRYVRLFESKCSLFIRK